MVAILNIPGLHYTYSPRAQPLSIMFLAPKGLTVDSYAEFSHEFRSAKLKSVRFCVISQIELKVGHRQFS